MIDISIDDRHADIVEQPPRIMPLDSSEVTDEQKSLIQDLWKVLEIPPRDEVPEFFATMLKHPQLMMAQTRYATQLLDSALPPRLRQLSILRIGWLCLAPFEWSQHAKNSKAAKLVTTEDVERVTQGSQAEGWTTEEQAILKAVEEMYDVAMISDETWTTLTGFLNEQQLLELPLLVGYYHSVAYLQNAVRFRLMPGSQGLHTR